MPPRQKDATAAPSAAIEPRWRRRPEERPRQIVEAALDVFGERGLANARLEDIAARAGVSKGTIYLYFTSKEELFREVIRSTMIANIERGEAVQSTGSATARLDLVLTGWWQLARTSAFERIFRLVMGELHDFPDLAEFYSTEVITRGLRLFTGIIEQGVATGEFSREIAPRVAARMLISTVISHAVWCSKPDLFTHVAGHTDDEVLEQIRSFILFALRPTPGARTARP
jgi:AcrR family transcriptional regulator